jgi:hypothetical protein
MSGEEEKLLRAIEKDEKLVEEEHAALMNADTKPVIIRIKTHSGEIPIQIRTLKEKQLRAFRRDLAKINSNLLSIKDLADIPVTVEEDEKIGELVERYIYLASGLSHEKQEEYSPRIRRAIWEGILRASMMTAEDLERIQKFRSDA